MIPNLGSILTNSESGTQSDTSVSIRRRTSEERIPGLVVCGTRRLWPKVRRPGVPGPSPVEQKGDDDQWIDQHPEIGHRLPGLADHEDWVGVERAVEELEECRQLPPTSLVECPLCRRVGPA
jgi:hypothetical protein